MAWMLAGYNANRWTMPKIAIVNVNLQYAFPDTMSDADIQSRLYEIELPPAYVEDSFEFVKIVKE